MDKCFGTAESERDLGQLIVMAGFNAQRLVAEVKPGDYRNTQI